MVWEMHDREAQAQLLLIASLYDKLADLSNILIPSLEAKLSDIFAHKVSDGRTGRRVGDEAGELGAAGDGGIQHEDLLAASRNLRDEKSQG
jgi:hypothetical protein